MAICSCGKKCDELHSYFDKASKYRVTCCGECAANNKLIDESKYDKTMYKNITAEQNKTPEPDAA